MTYTKFHLTFKTWRQWSTHAMLQPSIVELLPRQLNSDGHHQYFLHLTKTNKKEMRLLRTKALGSVVCGVLRPGDFILGAAGVQVSHMLLITLPIRSAAPKREREQNSRVKFVHIQSEWLSPSVTSTCRLIRFVSCISLNMWWYTSIYHNQTEVCGTR